MIFPDQVYINHIRDALWRRSPIGQAAVMVGAGFSRNARPATVAGGSLPTWSELTHRILNALYPKADAGQAWRRLSAEREMGATSGFLRLAEEYATAFGRLALEELIMELVPDRHFLPSELYNDLLALPWSDVLTTNWDTLLERAAEDVLERRYDVVTTMTEIAGSVKPRIVKLHGSMPSVRPFIFTEEDFRTYPRQYAPFVNLAQQTLMENVLCLIGFSGDDPNFLRWAGWVRDNLGVNQPRIYLVGGLDLSNSRRRLLEEQKVVPIDLARLPEWREWPEAVRHQNAVKWFLANLWRGQPYTKTQWPKSEKRNRRNLPNDWTQPPGNDGALRCEELPSGMTAENASAADILIVAKNWRHNRLLYPGWIVAPWDVGQSVYFNTKRFLPTILEQAKDLTPFGKFYIFHELIWCLDLALAPLSPEISLALDEILATPPENYRPDDEHRQAWPNDSVVRLAWVTMAVSRLRYAREAEDRQKFDELLKALRAYFAESPGLSQRLCYERCLFALVELDFCAVDRALADWPDSEDDPFWNVRKATILAEIKRTAEAERMLTTAYKEIRRRARKDTDDIPAMSREAWTTLFLSMGFRFFYYRKNRPAGADQFEDETVESGDQDDNPTKSLAAPPEPRWEALSAHKCDAQAEYWAMRTRMGAPPPPRPQKYSVKRGFDPGDKSHWEHWGSDAPYDRLLPAFQARRWIEETAIPPVVDNMSLGKEILTSVATWLTGEYTEYAIGIRLRMGGISTESDPLFNRPRLALISDEKIIQLYDRARKLIDYGLPLVGENGDGDAARDRQMHWTQRVNFALELASRLMERLPEGRVIELINFILGLYTNSIIGNTLSWCEGYENLFRRAFFSLSPHQLQDYALKLLDLPIPHFNGFKPSTQHWPDIYDVLSNLETPPERKPQDEPQWAKAIESMLKAAHQPGPAARPWAIRRLVLLHSWGLLSDKEKADFGDALWNGTTPSANPPIDTKLYDSAVLRLPEPTPGLALEGFKQRYLTVRPPDSKQLMNLCYATEATAIAPAALVLSAEEVTSLADTLIQARIRQKPNHNHPYFQEDVHKYKEYTYFLVRFLYQTILPLLPIDYSNVTNLIEWLERLDQADYPVAPIYPPLLRLQPGTLKMACEKIRRGLVSPEMEAAKYAVWGVELWIRKAGEWRIDPPPDDIVEELGLIVAQRRPAALLIALNSCINIVGDTTINQRFRGLILDGLRYLLKEMTYDREQVTGGIEIEDVPTIRAACVRLAATMRQTINWEGGQIPEILDQWLEAGRTDPLAEVRNAVPAPGPFGAGG